MFEFLNDWDSYAERAVARFEAGDLIVDTWAVSDSDQPYETGVSHPQYNDRKWVTVQLYDTIEQAKKGHDKWVKKMTAQKLPTTLKDVSTCGVNKLCKLMTDMDLNTEFEVQGPKEGK